MSSSTKAYFVISGDTTPNIMNIISREIGKMAEEALCENDIPHEKVRFFMRNDETRTSREPDIRINSFTKLPSSELYVIRGAYMTFDNNGFHYDIHVFFDNHGMDLMNHYEYPDGRTPTVSISLGTGSHLSIGSRRPSAKVIKRLAEAVKADVGCETYFIDDDSSGDLIQL